MTILNKEDVPWLHDDWEIDAKLYNKKTGEYTDLTEDQIKDILERITRKRHEEMQNEMK